MTILTLATLSLSISALCIATYALLVAHRSSDRSLRKALTELSERFSELSESHEAVTLQFRNLRSRLNMAILRDKRANPAESAAPDTPKIDAESEKDRWQREMNLKIATGQIRMPGR